MTGHRKASTLRRLTGAVGSLARRWQAWDANEREQATDVRRQRIHPIGDDPADDSGRVARRITMCLFAALVLIAVALLAVNLWH